MKSSASPPNRRSTIALRTQQIIAEEPGVANTIDPLAGSYFVEALTNEMEQGLGVHREDRRAGRDDRAIEKGFPQLEIADAAYAFQKQLERKEKIMVGVNRYQMEEKKTIEYLKIDPEVERRQLQRLQETKRARNQLRVQSCLEDLREAARGSSNLMPFVLAAVKEYATLQEMCDVFREVFGSYRDPGMF